MRGFMAGTIWGLVLVASGAVALSLLYPAPPHTQDESLPAPTTARALDQVADDPDSAASDADVVVVTRTAPDRQNRPDDLDPLAQADTDPAERPHVSTSPQGLTHPQETTPAPQVSIDGKVANVTPEEPQSDPSRAPVTAVPSQPVAPTVPDIGSGFQPGAAQPKLTNDTAAAGSVVSHDSVETADAPAPLSADETGYQPRQPRMAELPQTDSESGAMTPTVGSRVRSMADRNNKTITEGNAASDRSADEQRPLDQYAAPFANPRKQPLLSIVLIDDENAEGAEALKDFPHPISFAINPATPEASEKMAHYRAQLHEVLALVDLPAAATPQDAEVALSAGFDQLDQTVALLEGIRTGIRGSRELSDQTTAFLAATGRGLVTQNNGLNSVHKYASRKGVPSAVVFRDFDGAGQTPTAMRRFLDQATLRAGQEGAVIMLGRVRPDTISALLLWGNQDHSGRVVLAPVSAILRHSMQ